MPSFQGARCPRRLLPIALPLLVGHVALLADPYIRFDVLDVHASFSLRRTIGTKVWRRRHYLSFVALVAAAAHTILAGTDASRAWAIAICIAPLLDRDKYAS